MDDDQFLGLFFLDFWLIQRKAKSRFIIPGTEGQPGYAFKAWMKDYALPEHLLQWPFFDVSYHGGGPGRAGVAYQYGLVNCKNCGSGVLAIRAALTWTEAQVAGIDYWVVADAQELRDMGYQDERLIDTAWEAFGSRRWAAMMLLLGEWRMPVAR